MARPAIVDVARLAGVSTTTVSHALSGRRPVSPESKARVEVAVAQLGYRANALASGLRTRRTLTVALIVPDITNPFYPVVARGVQDAMSDAGYQIVVCSTDGDSDRELAFLSDMAARSVDGIILGQLSASADRVGAIIGRDQAVVTLGPVPSASFGDHVIGDNRIAAAAATRHLIARGRTRIAFVGSSGTVGPARERHAGYEDALLSAGLPLDPRLSVDGGYERASGRAGVDHLINSDVDFDSIFCVNDLTAIGALDALRAAGRSVPDDVSVVGFDDIEAADLIRPTLTTVDSHAHEKGAVCGRLLLQRLSGALTGPFRQIVVPGTLIVRESA